MRKAKPFRNAPLFMGKVNREADDNLDSQEIAAMLPNSIKESMLDIAK